MICKDCAAAADAKGVTQKHRDKLHRKCKQKGGCDCQHKPQGKWKGEKL